MHSLLHLLVEDVCKLLFKPDSNFLNISSLSTCRCSENQHLHGACKNFLDLEEIAKNTPNLHLQCSRLSMR